MMDVKEFRKRTGHTYDMYTDEEVQRVITYFYGVCKFFLEKDMKEIKEIIQNIEGSKENS